MANLVNYTEVGFKDFPNTDTPVNATNLNVLDTGIKNNASAINTLNDTLSEKVCCKLVSASLTVEASTKSSTTISYALPDGATVIGATIVRTPSPHWVYGGLNNVTDTSATFLYVNNYTSAITGVLTILVFYTI